MDTLELTQPVRTLPLWKHVTELMLKEGIDYGNTYETSFFERELELSRESMKFDLAMSEIRRALEHKGFYLSGRGQKGAQFVVLQAAANANVMENYVAAAHDALRRGVILGTNTSMDALTADEQKKHREILEKLSLRKTLLSKRDGTLRRLMG